MTNAPETPQDDAQPSNPSQAQSQAREAAAKRQRTAALIALFLAAAAIVACIIVAILVPGFAIPMITTAVGLILLLLVTKGTPRRVKESIRRPGK